MKQKLTILCVLMAMTIGTMSASLPTKQLSKIQTHPVLKLKGDPGLQTADRVGEPKDFKIGHMDDATIVLEKRTDNSYEWSFKGLPSATDGKDDYVLSIDGLYTEYDKSFCGTYWYLPSVYKNEYYPRSFAAARFYNQNDKTIDVNCGYISLVPEKDGTYTLSWYLFVANDFSSPIEGDRKISNIMISDKMNHDYEDLNYGDSINNALVSAVPVDEILIEDEICSYISSFQYEKMLPQTNPTNSSFFVKGKVDGEPQYNISTQSATLTLVDMSGKNAMKCVKLKVNNPNMLPKSGDWIIVYGTMWNYTPMVEMESVLTMQDGEIYQILPDYRPINLKVETSPGHMTFSWDVLEKAAYYYVKIFDGNDSENAWVTFMTSETSHGLISNSKEYTYLSRWEVYPCDEFYYTLENPSIGEPFGLEGNTFDPPYNLSVYSYDGETWNFSWEVPQKHKLGMTYVLRTIENASSVTVGYDTVSSDMLVYSYEKKMLYDATYSWDVLAFSNEDKEWKTFANGKNFTVYGVNDKNIPHNLSARPSGNQVVLQWSSEMPLFLVQWTSDDGAVQEDSVIAGLSNNGEYMLILTMPQEGIYTWKVTSMEELSNGNTVYYSTVKGENYLIGEEKLYSVHISATEGGIVNTDVNRNDYKRGDRVRIIAQPYTGYLFAGWSDGNTDAIRWIPIFSDVTLEARFIVDENVYYTLNLIAGDGGSVDESLNKRYVEGTVLTIVAMPEEGYVFSYWDDGDDHVARVITMNKDYTLKAFFNPTAITKSYPVHLDAGEGGTVNEEINGQYLDGSKLMAVATPNPGYVFNRWSDNITTPTREIVIDGKEVNLLAMFRKLLEFTLNVTVDNSEYGHITMTIDGKEVQNGTYQEETVVDIEAVAEEGCSFVKWSDENTEPTRRIVLRDNVELVAHFVKSEAIETVEQNSMITKLIRNGQLFILRGDKTYTTTGQVVK